MKRLFAFLLTVTLAISGIAFADTAKAAPTLVVAKYKVYRNGILVGQNEERFERKGDRYVISSDAQALGAIALFVRDHLRVKSEGRIGAQGLQPDYFESLGGKASRDTRTRFDWPAQALSAERNGTTETFALPVGTQDRLSSMYQFMFVNPTGKTINTWMTSGKQSSAYVYVRQGEEKIKTGAGEFATIHYVRDAAEGESKAQFWLAKDQRYLPVRVVFEDKSAKFEQLLVQLTVM